MSKEKFYWQDDTWGALYTEDNTFEFQLSTCDNSGRQYINFYPEQTDNVQDSMKVLAHYEVFKRD